MRYPEGGSCGRWVVEVESVDEVGTKLGLESGEAEETREVVAREILVLVCCVYVFLLVLSIFS